MNMAEMQRGDSSIKVEARLRNGPAGAAILSAGAGCCALGILALVADASRPVSHWLTFYFPTGPLSGVSSIAILLWLAMWLVLAQRWKTKTVAIARINALAFALLLIGFLLTYPPLGNLLIGK